HRLPDALQPGGSVEVRGGERAVDLPALVHPRVGTARRVPQVVMGVDAAHGGPDGKGTCAGIRPVATSSAQRSAGTQRSYRATSSCSSATERTPTRTLVTAGWPYGKASAAARNGTPCLAHASCSLGARATRSR